MKIIHLLKRNFRHAVCLNKLFVFQDIRNVHLMVSDVKEDVFRK